MQTPENTLLTREQCINRLRTLREGLEAFPAGIVCPWPAARIFNELLKQARNEAPSDPILKGIRFVGEGSSESGASESDALSGTVSLLAQQVIVALETAPPVGKPPAPKRTRAKVER